MGGKGGVGMCTAGGSVQLREGERVEGDLRVPFSQMNHWYDNHLTGVLSVCRVSIGNLTLRRRGEGNPSA